MAKTPLEIEIASLARMHTEEAVKTLAAIMNDPHAPDAARIAAAEALLDVGWGKPRHEAEITFEEIHEQRFRPNPNSA
jgi:HEAT repeat protein